jgi:hypothetical protein
MQDLRHTYTYEQRQEFQDTLCDMRRYILPLLLERQQGVCDRCKLPSSHYDIDHLVYNPILTLNELRLLCIPCHYDVTDYSHRIENITCLKQS